MVWDGFSGVEKTELAILVDKQNIESYTYTIPGYLLPFAHREYGTESRRQLNNTSIHISLLTMDFFAKQGVDILDWPDRSPN